MKARHVLPIAALLLLTACGSQTAAAPATVTATTQMTVTQQLTTAARTTIPVTITAKPKTVTATATVTSEVTAAAPAATKDPNGPKKDGNYLVPLELSPGTWQCSAGDDSTFWRMSDQAGDTIDNGFSTIASIGTEAFTADFERCNGIWTKVA